jgi:hypothetical protein
MEPENRQSHDSNRVETRNCLEGAALSFCQSGDILNSEKASVCPVVHTSAFFSRARPQAG